MNLLLPQRRTSQPQYPVGIDWSNPITRGLITTMSPQWCRTSDGVGSKWSVATGTFGTAITPTGLALNGTMRLSGPTLTTTSDFTLLTVGAAISQTFGPYVMASSGNLWLGVTTLNYVVSNSGTDTVIGAYSPFVKFTLVGVRSGSTLIGYVNGVFGGSSANVPTTSTTLSVMDYSSGGFSWPGSVALVLAWNRALSASEVASISANPRQIFTPQVT